MASSVFGVPLLSIEGETKTLSTSAGYVAVKPNFHEVKMYCASQWRLALSPALMHAIYYNGTTYTEYVQSVTDRLSATHMPLDGMTTSHYVYLGTSEPVLGFYFDIGTGVQAEAATLDVEYCYDGADASYKKITGTVSAALTVGETVTGATSAATATVVYSGADYIVVKSVSGTPVVGETFAGATQNISATTAITTNDTLAFFTDVAGDDDATDNPAGTTLAIDGAYVFTLPAVKSSRLGTLNVPLFSQCYWIRFTPSATLSDPTDINEIIPIYQNANYGYMEPGMEYQFSVSTPRCGGFVVLATAGTPALDISWVKH